MAVASRATVVGIGATGGFPRWKHNANLGSAQGPWSANLNQRSCGIIRTNQRGRARGRYVVSWDLNGAYSGFKNWTLSLGVKNLFRSRSAVSRQSNAFQLGYDPSLADPTGRFFWGAVKYTFK